MKSKRRGFSFTLTGLLLAVLPVGAGIAAIRYANDLLASIAFTVAWLALMLAVLGIIYRRAESRAFWVGFLIVGGGYLLSALGPWFGESLSQHLVTTRLLAYVQQSMREVVPMPQTPGMPGGGGPSMGAAVGGMPSMGGGMAMPGGGGIPGGGVMVLGPTYEDVQRVGHSWLALMLAVAGGMAGQWFYRSGPSSAETQDSR